MKSHKSERKYHVNEKYPNKISNAQSNESLTLPYFKQATREWGDKNDSDACSWNNLWRNKFLSSSMLLFLMIPLLEFSSSFKKRYLNWPSLSLRCVYLSQHFFLDIIQHTPLVVNELRIWDCHRSSLGHCCGTDSIPGPGTSICHRCGQINK